MTDPTSPEPRSPREELRVQLALLLPAHAVLESPSGMRDPQGHLVLEHDVDYDPAALAAWILDQYDAAKRDVMLGAISDLESLEADQAAMIELATAGATFTATAEWARFLGQMPAVLRRGLNIKDAHDFAASLEQEHARVLAMLAALAERFPALRALLGDAVGTRARGLERADGVPLAP